MAYRHHSLEIEGGMGVRRRQQTRDDTVRDGRQGVHRRHLRMAMALIAVTLVSLLMWRTPAAYAFVQSPALRKFKDLAGNPIPLRGLGPEGIPVALPDGTPAPVTGVTHYTIS